MTPRFPPSPFLPFFSLPLPLHPPLVTLPLVTLSPILLSTPITLLHLLLFSLSSLPFYSLLYFLSITPHLLSLISYFFSYFLHFFHSSDLLSSFLRSFFIAYTIQPIPSYLSILLLISLLYPCPYSSLSILFHSLIPQTPSPLSFPIASSSHIFSFLFLSLSYFPLFHLLHLLSQPYFLHTLYPSCTSKSPPQSPSSHSSPIASFIHT